MSGIERLNSKLKTVNKKVQSKRFSNLDCISVGYYNQDDELFVLIPGDGVITPVPVYQHANGDLSIPSLPDSVINSGYLLLPMPIPGDEEWERAVE